MAFYPQHDKRRETPEYKAIHRKLVVDEDRPCLVCGVKNSTLKDPSQNLYGAKQMETHHRLIEWALANAIDADKFNRRVLKALRRTHPDRADYQNDFPEDQVRAWVDHDPDNLWVLCDVHHRAQFFGIHAITYPIWGPVDLLRDDFEDYVREQLKQARSARRTQTKRSVRKTKQ
jgi:hypothetical protein